MGIQREETMIVNGRLAQQGLSFKAERSRERVAVFLCQCGERAIIVRRRVKAGLTKSCGCLKPEVTSKTKRIHGCAGNVRTQGYQAWKSMRRRCSDKKSKDWKDYGERGITVCDRWKSFAAFLEDMGEPPKGLSLDRRNTNGNYSPENCRWATAIEQNTNSRRNRVITHEGKTMCLSEWARYSGMATGSLHKRLKDGWVFGEAITTPVRKRLNAR